MSRGSHIVLLAGRSRQADAIAARARDRGHRVVAHPAAEPVTAVVTVTAPCGAEAPFLASDPECLDWAVRDDVLVALDAVRAALPHGPRVVLTVGCRCAAYPPAGRAVHAMTSAAIESITRSLAAEYGPQGMHVQGFAPGRFTTGRSVTGGPADPAEVAREVVAALERPQPLLAGHTVPLDGGLSPFGVNRGPNRGPNRGDRSVHPARGETSGVH